jgi:GTP-binding protein EngB required for normal cell division
MDTKPMVIVTQNDRLVDMIGYGYNQMGDSLSDYGLTLYLTKHNVEIVVLTMYDRNVQIAYLKEGKSVVDKGNLLQELAIWGFDFNF